MDISLRWADVQHDRPTLERFLALVLTDGTDFVNRVGLSEVQPACHAYFSDWGRPDDRALIALAGPRRVVVGAAWVRRPLSGGVPFLGLAVEAHARGEGVGRALLQACQRDAMDRGHDLTLTVHATNPAIRLYRQCGFREVGLMEEPSTGPMVKMAWSLPVTGGGRRRRLFY